MADEAGAALVDTVGYETAEVNTTLQEVVELVSEWRSTKRRATRMRPDLDGSAAAAR